MEGPNRIRELMEFGLQFDEREVSGHRELDLGKEGGHSKRRVLHVRDVTGKEIEDTLLRELGRQSNVELFENHMAVDLITAGKLGFATEDRCLGVYVLDEKTGEGETIRSDTTVLATRGGVQCVFLDITHKAREFIRERFPHIYETCQRFGIDMSRQPIPVVPAAHYQCGGIKTDVNGATSLPGLYAIGEVGCTGLHGANRLASNSLLEGLVVAHRAAESAVGCRSSRSQQQISLPEWQSGDVQDVDELVVIYHNWDEIRRLMWDYVGIVRTDKRLQRASARLRNLQREIREFYWHFKVSVDLWELRT